MCKTSRVNLKLPSCDKLERLYTRAVVFRRGLIALFCLLVAARAAAEEGLPLPFQQALAAANIPVSHVAVYVQDSATATPLLTVNATTAMNPASVMKLLTTFAALDILGPAYRWKTDVYYDGNLRGETLNGDLIFKGYGDPKITLENFWLMLRDLRQRGIKTLRGNLVLDRRYFDVPQEDLAAFDGAPTKPYNLSPDALLLDFRSQRLRIYAHPGLGAPRILLDPPIPGASVVNALHLSEGECGDWKDQIELRAEKTQLVFSGTYARSCGEQILPLILQDRDAYFATVFKEIWMQVGGRWQGKVREGALPDTARLLATYPSASLAETIRDINKFSNNVMARQVFLSLGAETRGLPATPEKGVAAISDWLARRGQNFLELNLENGAGLSRKERISAQHLGWLLHTAYRSLYFPEFAASLPLVALDGTMKKRLMGTSIAGHARLKSGSLKNVRALAGYVRDVRGRDIILVCIINDVNAEQGRPAQDVLLNWIFNRP